MSLNKILASLALILALIAALIGTPTHVEINAGEIAALVDNEKDHITPIKLAEQIMEGKKIILIDLRDSSSYAQEHIANAALMSMQTLVNGGIKRNETVVLYSEGGIHASQAWILLKMKRYDSVYTLLGGYNGWKEEIVFPALKPGTSVEEIKSFERRKTLSQFFGGEPTIISQEPSKIKSDQGKRSTKKQNSPVKFQKEEEKLRDQC